MTMPPQLILQRPSLLGNGGFGPRPWPMGPAEALTASPGQPCQPLATTTLNCLAKHSVQRGHNRPRRMALRHLLRQ